MMPGISRRESRSPHKVTRYSAALTYGTLSVLLLFLCVPAVDGQRLPPAATAGEQRVTRAFDAARRNPLDLRAFLRAMPKGADLHYHLGGGVYAESYLRAAAEDRLCVDVAKLAFAKPADASRHDSEQPDCGEGSVPAESVYSNQHLYDALVDSFSMRGFVPSAGVTGHDHFFDTFAKFSGTSQRHKGEWLDEIATSAAAQNEQYLELMDTPNFSHTIQLSKEVGWKENLGEVRSALLEHGLRDDVTVAIEHFRSAEALRLERERCGQVDAAAACRVEIRFLYQVLRGFPKEQVFAQTLLGFEVASAAPELVVGINFVMPEDGYTAMHDYALQMKMVRYLHREYPKVHITLHAGELAYGMVPPEGLCCHIALAIQAGAERIGHGVDVMYEDKPYTLLREMAARHVMVEINLTSNDVILGVKGREHPFPIYRRFGVPVALSTDDEGVSRIDLTNEYVRAVETYGLSYTSLKQMARTGLEHAFLPGHSLWASEDVFARTVSACSADTPGADKPSSQCASFLASSEKAQQQWELERRFRAFEKTF
jgi:adenosine deaminase